MPCLDLGERPGDKRIALIAHDNCKSDMLAWARFNVDTLRAHELHATGTTGALLAEELDLSVHRFLSGPLGDDQRVAAAIAEGRIDFALSSPLTGDEYQRPHSAQLNPAARSL
ncbi:MAG: methylglyoxal synthase [Solirubrobacteraceae bacterium]